MKLLPHQIDALSMTVSHNRVAYYYDMGLGKTFIGSEKLMQLGAGMNLVIVQKSKIEDWETHFKQFYDYPVIRFDKHLFKDLPSRCVLIINYDLVWRRTELSTLKHFTLMLDESSHIKNESSKRTKFIMKLKPANVILLSGTPTGGKYEELWSQCKLLGWEITKTMYWDHYVDFVKVDMGGFPVKIIKGYKNVDRLKAKLREHGAVFMKTEEVITLPESIEVPVNVKNTKEYKKFKRDRIIEMDRTLVGDTPLTRLLYLRQLAAVYNPNKMERLKELLESTNDRVIVFYNFNLEYEQITRLCNELDKPISTVNGSLKSLSNYEAQESSVTLIQYQAGAMGLNLQKSNKIIYYSLPLSSELFEQSKARIRRIGQSRSCWYYYLLTEESIELQIFETLKLRKDFTDKLFEEVEG